MAKYSYDKYGNFIYGTPNETTTPYYQANVSAESLGYLLTRIRWQPIVPDPLIGTPSHWALVKTFNGRPDNPYDGRIVAYDVMDSYVTSWVEQYVNVEDVEVNYSIWVYTSGYGWIFCGDNATIIIAENNTSDLISKWLPRAWQNELNLVGDSVGEYEMQDLMASITAYSIEYDRFRTVLRMLENTTTPKYMTKNYSAVKQLDYGFVNEPNLGDSYFRTLSLSGEKINSLKGTLEGISLYINALTHVQNRIEIGHNLFLDYNDSSFEESTGRWEIDNPYATFTNTTYTEAGLTAPSPRVYDIDALPRSIGLAKVVTAVHSFALNLPEELVYIETPPAQLDKLIPIKPNTRYIFTGWARSSILDSVNVTITWKDIYGKLISTTETSSTTLLANTWTEFKSASDGYRNGKMSPPKAAFVSLAIARSSTANATLYFDMFQFCEWKYSLSYEDPRLIKIYLRGQEENLLHNPHFYGLNGWTVTNADVISADGALVFEALAEEYTDSGLGDYTGTLISSEWMEVDPGINYTFSIDPDHTISNPYTIGIEFSNSTTEEDQTSLVNLNNTYYYDVYTYNQKKKISRLVYDSALDTLTFFLDLEVGEVASDTFTVLDVVSVIGSTVFPSGTTYTISSVSDPYFICESVSLINLDPEGLYTEDGITTEYSPGYVVGQDVTYSNKVEVYHETVPGPGTQKENKVVGTAPQITKDTATPYARVYLKVHAAVLQQEILNFAKFAPSLVQDRTLTSGIGQFEGLLYPATYGGSDPVSINPQYETEYFDGYGNDSYRLYYYVDSLPGENKFYDFKDSSWETSIRYNFVSNSNFETNITGWSAINSSVLSQDTSQGALSTKSLKITDTSGTQGGASVDVTLPYPAVGGESVTVSAYVKGLGTYELYSPDVYVQNQKVFTDSFGTAFMRIDNTFILDQAQDTFTLQILSTLASGTTTCNIDGVQAEWGPTASQFILTTDPGTFELVNPNTSSDTLWAAYNQRIDGRSNYIPNWGIKFNRLFATLSKYVPLGSSWTLKTGWPTREIQDINTSLIPSASFEHDLGDWSGEGSTIKRVAYKGSQLDHVTHGIAYAEVTSTKLVDALDYTFGVTTDKIYINPNKGYYGSIAVRPKLATGASGFYKIIIDAYNSDGVLLQSYDNAVQFVSEPLPGTTFTFSSTAPSSPIVGDRWLYDDGTSARMYTWIEDVDGYQWAEIDEQVYYVGNYQPDTRYTYSDIAPESPSIGDRWIDTTSQIGYVWLNASTVGATSYWLNGTEYPTTNATAANQWVELSVVYTDSSAYVGETYAPRWAYLNIVLSKENLVLPIDDPLSTLPLLEPVDYVKMRVLCTPDAYQVNQSFQIDRAVFRE